MSNNVVYKNQKRVDLIWVDLTLTCALAVDYTENCDISVRPVGL